MKLILLLAAIYALIINQCYKTAKEQVHEDKAAAITAQFGKMSRNESFRTDANLNFASMGPGMLGMYPGSDLRRE